ncbi:hypothetical protein OC834_007962, partial [Tilletia horrida]
MSIPTLPGEILLRIVDFALIPSVPAEETLHSYAKAVAKLDVAPWLIRERDTIAQHHSWWHHFQQRGPATGLTLIDAMHALPLSRLPLLRTISLDLIDPDVRTKQLAQRSEGTSSAEAIHMLKRLCVATTTLQEFNIRLPAVQDLIELVEAIVKNNTSLLRVEIHVHSVQRQSNRQRPRIHLDRLSSHNFTYASFT